MRVRILVAVCFAALALSGCASMRTAEDAAAAREIPTLRLPAPQPATRAVVILPGRGDDLKDLRRSGIADAVQGVWPDTDVIFAELRLGDYRRGDAPQRLHTQVIAPARAQGYREVWLGGASMGGMGTLMHERLYPGAVDGLILLAPYLGGGSIPKEIRQAGGLAQWTPGPVRPVSAGTWQRELWRHLQTWTAEPARTRQVWLAYGDRDRLRDAIGVLAPVLSADRVLVRPGGHAWTVWTPAAAELLRRADAAARQANPATPQSSP